MKLGLWEFTVICQWYADKGHQDGYSWWLYGCFHFRKWDSKKSREDYFK